MVKAAGAAGMRRTLAAALAIIMAAGIWLAAWPTSASTIVRTKTELDLVAPYRRLLWVTRWDYRTADDIAKITYNAASARFTDILFQVRGEGTVFFRSDVEPWAWELTGKNASSVGQDPGWDPLATMIAEGHKYGLRVHAYMNVLPGWAQKTAPPASSRQLLARHPDWFMVDRQGKPMRGNWYRFLDPGRPEVVEHLSALFGEVATQYAVDGIHLDYIRFPFEEGDYSYAPPVVSAFKQAFGGTPQSKPEQWQQYRCGQITQAVRAIADAARKARPAIEISSAVIADPVKGRELGGQLPEEWLASGLIDAVAPMAYTKEMPRFDAYLERFGGEGVRGRVWPGIIADPAKNGLVTEQIKRAAEQKFGGVALFAYSNLFDGHKANGRARAVYEAFTGKGGA